MHPGMFMLYMTDAFIYGHKLGRPSLLTHNALGIMVRLQSLPWRPMHAIKKAMQTFQLLMTKMMKTNAMHE